jgi:hypothetical protein
MFYVSIKKQNIETNAAKFETLDLANAWIAQCESEKTWGFPQWIEDVPEQIEITIDGDGVQHQTTIPAHQVVHPAEYEVVIEDITAAIEAEAMQVAAVQAAQQAAGLRLQAFPAQVDACQDLEALKSAIKLFVSDVAVLLVK